MSATTASAANLKRVSDAEAVVAAAVTAVSDATALDATEPTKVAKMATAAAQKAAADKALLDLKWISFTVPRGDAIDVNGTNQWDVYTPPTSGTYKPTYDANRTAGQAQRTKACASGLGSKDAELRAILMVQLEEMGADADADDRKAGTSGKAGCGLTCDEDLALDDMQKLYTELSEDGAGSCKLGDFSTNPNIIILNAMIDTLDYTSFSFLHRSCQGTNNCNPYALNALVPNTLIACSGLMDGAAFFYDSDLEAVGAHLAGSQGSPNGFTPASRGHCANFYKTGTIAPGRGSDSKDPPLYVNVCYEAQSGDRGALQKTTNGKWVGVKWVKANKMEKAKYYSLKKLKDERRRQKRIVLSVNRKMLQLQQSLVGLRPQDNAAYSEDNANALFSDNLRAVVRQSTNRVRRGMNKRYSALVDREDKLAMPFRMKGSAAERRAATRKLNSLSRGRSGSRGGSRGGRKDSNKRKKSRN
jgi:hypothetical protein